MENGENIDGIASISEMEKLRRQEEAAMEMIKEGQELLELNQKAVATLQEGFRSKNVGSKLDVGASMSDNVSYFVNNMYRITDIKKYCKGDNFPVFCERFKAYVCIAKLNDLNLYLYFLQLIDDDHTYSILKTVDLSANEKRSADSFCEKYKEALYGDELFFLKSKLLNCTQMENEDISGYVYRMREMASIAYKDRERGEENCLLAFLKGVKSTEMRIKLNESIILNFTDAVKLANKIERVERTLNSDQEPDNHGGDHSPVSNLKSNGNLNYVSKPVVDRGNLDSNCNSNYVEKSRVNRNNSNSNGNLNYRGKSDGRKNQGNFNSNCNLNYADCSPGVKRTRIAQCGRKESCEFSKNQRFSNGNDGSSWDFPCNKNNGGKSGNSQSGQKFSRKFNLNFRSGKSDKIFRCWTCDKIGHKAVNCWYKMSETNGITNNFGPSRKLKRQYQDLN